MYIDINGIYNKNIIHRDTKPENLFTNEKTQIKIEYLDISKQFNPNKKYTKILNKTGFLFYIESEIIRDGIYNKKFDMYSLGCIIYKFFNLNNYYIDRDDEEIKIKDSKKYNYKRKKSLINYYN